jgi:molybdopterin molybdotransferase
MNEFLKLLSPLESKKIILDAIPKKKKQIEIIDTENSLGRILAINIQANHPLPEFPRSSMDGYAVNSQDTFGASETQPGYLSLVGEILMGIKPELNITRGTCALIHTGGMIPDGADAVVILEQTQLVDTHSLVEDLDISRMPGPGFPEVEIFKAVARGENIIQIGEDVATNEIVIQAGTRIRYAEIGGCMALGVTRLQVFSIPKVGILSCGDEIISPDNMTTPGKVRDINSYTMASLIHQFGGEPVLYGIIPDDFQKLSEVATSALLDCDMVLITAGSSASARDTTSRVISSLGKPGILVHGINIRPGKPTILAVCNGKPVMGLPGNPVSAIVIAQLFLLPVMESVMGVVPTKPTPTILARLEVNLSSQTGREDWIPVRVTKVSEAGNNGRVIYKAEPIFGKSNLIFSLVKADGLLRIPSAAVGFPAGELVEVMLI